MVERRILESWKAIAAHLGHTGKTCRKWERELGLPVHRLGDSSKAHVFAYADEIDQWREKHEAVPARREGAWGFRKYSFPRVLLKTRAAIPALLGLIAVAIGAARYADRRSKIHWANDIAIPEIERLMLTSEFNRIADLALRAEKYAPQNPRLARLIPQVVADLSVDTDPPGADVYIRDYRAGGENWLDLGKSPVRNFRLSQGFKHWLIEKAGFETAEGTLYVKPGWGAFNLTRKMDRKGETPPGMVRVTGADFRPFLYGLSHLPSAGLGDYYLDKYEVTNRQFQEFVDGGGYQQKRYWINDFIRDGRPISWEEGMKEFVDRTGRPGPAAWESGRYPAGQGDYPVSGVSWYEASAYAEFAGKRLPSVYHWNRAAMSDLIGAVMVPLCNLQGRGLAASGSFRTLGQFGTYDMVGNVMEWCANEMEGQRTILGAAWNSNQYMFARADFYPPFFRAENFGFRCLKPKPGETDPPETYAAVRVVPPPDFSHRKPCSGEAFEIIRDQYVYAKSDLKATVESQEDRSEYTRLEKVAFDDAYHEDRIIAYLFLPRRGHPPFQTIIYFPGSAARQLDSLFQYGNVKDGTIEVDNRYGRAFVFPVLEGMFERRLKEFKKVTPQVLRERSIRTYRELARTIDYLETRPEFDKTKLVFESLSEGGWGAVLVALEKRYRAAVFLSSGIWSGNYLPELYVAERDPIHFLPRITIPVLMQNGKYDCVYSMEGIKRRFNLLGTPDKDKHIKFYETGHTVSMFNECRKDKLDFLDGYLGPAN